MKKIKDYMTAHAHTLGAEQTLTHAKHFMYEHGIRHLPVLNGGRLVGVLSDRDIKLAFAVDGNKAKDTKAGESCTTETYSADVTEELKIVAATMAQKAIGCCVVTEKEKVVGIFTATDACRVLSKII